jgi:RNA 2',3'-cyclic 3'-phosphodiesterase
VVPDPTIEGNERVRLFVGLRLPAQVVAGLVDWQAAALAGARVRVVGPENLHVTIAFLGARPAAEIDGIISVVRTAAADAARPLLHVARYRETARVGMLVLREDEPRHAHRLAGNVMRELQELGVYEPEKRDWSPHVTVARFRDQPRLAPAVPDLGEISPSEVALYHSVLRPTGAQYAILESVALGG